MCISGVAAPLSPPLHIRGFTVHQQNLGSFASSWTLYYLKIPMGRHLQGGGLGVSGLSSVANEGGDPTCLVPGCRQRVRQGLGDYSGIDLRLAS